MPVFKRDKKGKLIYAENGDKIQIGTRTEVDWQPATLPVCVRHGYRRHRPRKPKQEVTVPPRESTIQDWNRRGVMMTKGDLAFGRTPRDYQIRLRLIRDGAGAHLRDRGIWNPSLQDMEEAIAIVCGVKAAA